MMKKWVSLAAAGWLFVAPARAAHYGTDLDAVNNLSDVASVATARVNLGAAASGANGDITSLTGLTTPLPASEGGCGTASLAACLTALAAMPLAGGTFTGAVHHGSNLVDGSNFTVTGGTIDGTPIGGTTTAAGKFTSLNASGVVTFGGLISGFVQTNASGIASIATTVPASSVIATTGTIAAAGTTLAGATNASNGINTVGSGTGGIKSPVAQSTGTCITAYNNSGATINYYPDSTSDTINALGAGVAHTIVAQASLVVCRVSATNFIAYGGS